MTQAFSRIEASKSAANVRIADAFKNEAGAFDLPSILVGVVVVGVLTAGVLASIFGVIPFAQDKGAQQDLASITTAEGVYKAQSNGYTDLTGLQADAVAGSGKAGNLISKSVTKVAVKSTSVGDFAAATKSGSGKVFYITDANTNPQSVDPAAAAADATLSADAKSAIAAAAAM